MSINKNISVIIPVYNGGQYLPKRYWIVVRTISKNKHIQKSNFEGIVCDLKSLKVSI